MISVYSTAVGSSFLGFHESLLLDDVLKTIVTLHASSCAILATVVLGSFNW